MPEHVMPTMHYKTCIDRRHILTEIRVLPNHNEVRLNVCACCGRKWAIHRVRDSWTGRHRDECIGWEGVDPGQPISHLILT